MSAQMLETIIRYRRDLHQIPELMFDLKETRDYILNAMKDTRAAVEVTEKGGITFFYDNGKSHAMAFRADMDALPLTEQTGVSFASRREGMMHACGHDGHMAMLLTFCRWMEDHTNEAACNVLAVFQPAEESGGGAEHIAKSDLFRRRNVKGIYAFHVDPQLPEGVIASRPGEFMAKASELTITVRGRSSHVAEWQKGVDASEACASLYLELLWMERELPPEKLRLLKFGRVQSGTAANIISDCAVLYGTMRAFDMDTFRSMKDSVCALARRCEETFGVRVEIDLADGYPPVINDAALYEKAADALKGMDFRRLPSPEMIAEDFAFYLDAVPGLMMKVGMAGGVRLHSPELMFREEPLLAGVEADILLAKRG